MGVSYPKNSAGGWLAGLTPAPGRPSLRAFWANPLGRHAGYGSRVLDTLQNLLPACLAALDPQQVELADQVAEYDRAVAGTA